MPINYCVFKTWFHFLPADCRKSCNSSTLIFNRLISYACSLMISSGLVASAFFRGLPFFFGRIPASLRACSLLYRLIQLLICDFSNPRLSAISLRVFPAARILRISGSNSLIFVYFLDIARPPRVVLLSYTGRPFVYCLLFTDRFMLCMGHLLRSVCFSFSHHKIIAV